MSHYMCGLHVLEAGKRGAYEIPLQQDHMPLVGKVAHGPGAGFAALLSS